MNGKIIRIGIDVGGTHTKAVAIDNITHEIVGKATVMTTHNHEMGVSAGIIQVFQKCLNDNEIKPSDVIFIAHSTTQATNALLEGDVAKVGVIGMANKGFESLLGKKQTFIKDIQLEIGKQIDIKNAFIVSDLLNEKTVEEIILRLLEEGAQVIVASKAFGVDTADDECFVQAIGEKLDVPVTKASDISKLYGLNIRTRTAVINASILPKMFNTAMSIEAVIRENGIKAPLMIMRGDGGVMNIDEMKKRPVLTMLSGPAASVVGALMYLKVSNGIYFEVGGTSTNIGVIKNGRPAVGYTVLGGHRTYVPSLDVRVLGIAGGSMVRIKNGKIFDVGPRSAHIAGFPYAAFTPPDEIIHPAVEFISPKEGDPNDYVLIRAQNGNRLAVTNTCAANALGLVTEDMFSYGNTESCRIAIQALADAIGISMEECAIEILTRSFGKIVKVIDTLVEQYHLDREQMFLVGCGGGAGSLLPFAAEQLNIKYIIPQEAEVISSIGVALSMVRDVVERTIPNPSAQDISSLKKEAISMAENSGALKDTIEVQIEIDSATNRVTAIALGSTEVRTTDLLKSISQEEALEIAADCFNADEKKVSLEAKTEGTYVVSLENGDRRRVCIIDKKGFVKIQCSNARIVITSENKLKDDLYKMWDTCSVFMTDNVITPDIFLCAGNKIVDCCKMISSEKVYNVLQSELEYIDKDTSFILIGERKY